MRHLRERIQFIKVFKSDKNVGAITASSRFVVRNVVKHIPKNAKTIIECGPGEGVMTKELLKRLPLDGTLFVVEANKEFVEVLQKIRDKRLVIAEGMVQDITAHAKKHNIISADFVVASIPFSFVTPKERIQIVRDIHALLRPGGVFIIFNYSPLMYRTMKRVFGNAEVALEPRNIPPCVIVIGRKGK